MSNKQIYFGRYDGTVQLLGGTSDGGKPISFSVKQAYNYYQSNSYKQYKWAQFLVQCEQPVSLGCQLSVDFKEALTNVVHTGTTNLSGAAEWDVCPWDTCEWGVSPFTQRWISAFANYGVTASHWLVGNMMGVDFSWFSTEHVYEPSTGLL
jgi:hypothetical protein